MTTMVGDTPPGPGFLVVVVPGPVESTIFVMNTYVNVAFLRLLLSVVQLAKSDQHLEEELIFCAQPNPLSQ